MQSPFFHFVIFYYYYFVRLIVVSSFIFHISIGSLLCANHGSISSFWFFVALFVYYIYVRKYILLVLLLRSVIPEICDVTLFLLALFFILYSIHAVYFTVQQTPAAIHCCDIWYKSHAIRFLIYFFIQFASFLIGCREVLSIYQHSFRIITINITAIIIQQCIYLF